MVPFRKVVAATNLRTGPNPFLVSRQCLHPTRLLLSRFVPFDKTKSAPTMACTSIAAALHTFRTECCMRGERARVLMDLEWSIVAYKLPSESV